MELFIQLGIFALSTFMLVKSADYFIDGVVKLGVCWRLPHFITGVLIMAIGTSLPEFATSMASVLKHESDMLAGNVLGTIIANIFLGLGAVAFLSRTNIKFDTNVFQVHFPIFIISVAITVLTLWDGVMSPFEGMFFFGVFIAYLWFLFTADKADHPEKVVFSWLFLVIPALALVGLATSSEFVIRSIISIAEIAGLGKTALAATLVAVGTSLPEIMVGFTMVKKKMFDMAVGNILGSNIFDILLIFGVGSLFHGGLKVSEMTMTIIVPFMVATLFIYWGISKDKEITRQEGLAMLCLYGLFLGKLFGVI